MIIKILAGVAICLAASSCASLKPTAFAAGQPGLNPVTFFGGKTASYGTLEARNGKPSVQITTTTTGVYKDGVLTIEQDLFPENAKPNHRSFQLKQIDEHHISSTASDIEGTAHGLLYGNYFTWAFRLKVKNKGLVKHVRMAQYMYLMPGGQTMIIRSVIRKFGVIVQEITEQFTKVS